jgi:hypothetical protein
LQLKKTRQGQKSEFPWLEKNFPTFPIPIWMKIDIYG